MKNTVERAYELARTGKYRLAADVARALAAEDYDNVPGHMAGASIKKSLQLICDAARRPKI